MSNVIGMGLTLVVGGGAVAAASVAAVMLLRPAPDAVVAPEAPVEAVAPPETAVEASVPRDGVAVPQVPEAPVDATVPSSDVTVAVAAPPVAQVPVAPSPEAPVIEVVRVDAAGSAVVAGTGQAGADVIIRIDDDEVTRTTADRTGNFVSLFTIEPSASPRILTVETVVDGGEAIRAAESVIVAPRAPAAMAQAPTASPEATMPEVRTEPAGSPAQPEALARAAAPSDAPQLFRLGPEGVETFRTGPVVVEDVGLDTITYDDDGNVRLAGLGPRESDLRIYIDNQAVELARVDKDGSWTTSLPSVDTGTYTLRVDAVDEGGSVTSRVETPFQRSDPEDAVIDGDDGVTLVTVQPGLTLWEISEGHFGEGRQYVQIFEQNRDLIRDPDMIFPGQIFKLPDRQ